MAFEDPHFVVWKSAHLHDVAEEDQAALQAIPAPLRDALIVFGPPFVHRKRFYVTLVAAWLVGVVDALVGLLFYWCFERGSRTLWATPAFEEAMAGDGWGLLQGEWWYVLMGAGGGLLLSVFKAAYGTLVTVLPDSIPPLFTEIRDTEVDDWRAAPGVFVLGLISLCVGSSLGPEATLASVGSTVGYLVWRLTDRCVAFGVEEDAAADPACVGDEPPAAGPRQEAGGAGDLGGTPRLEEPGAALEAGAAADPEQGPRTPASVEECGGAAVAPHRANSRRSVRFSERDRKLLILAGISGAMGAVFPSPLVPALLVVEIDSLVSDYPAVRRQGELRVTALEKMFVISASSSVSYALYGAISSNTFMKENTEAQALFSQQHVYEYRQLFSAVVLGLFSGAFGLLGFTMNFLATQHVGKLRQRLNRLGRERFGMQHPARQLGGMLVPVVGGLLWGLCAVFLPLTLGSGEPQIKFLFNRDMGAPFLCLLAFAKMATLSISTSSGFVGGSIFPLMFAGTCLGIASSDLNPTGPASDSWASIFFCGWPVGLAVPCMAAGLPCAFSPAIITMVVIVFLILNLQALAVSHVFVASAVSFTTVCGLGLSQSILLGRSALVRRAPARARKGGEGESPGRTRPDSQE